MKTKDSKLYRYSNKFSKPSLVSLYEQFTRSIYERRTVVPRSQYGMFISFDEELHNLNISGMEYTETVLTSMKQWVKEHKVSCLPIHIFLSPFCVKKFKRIHDSATVTMKEESDSTAVLHDELTVLTYYIDCKVKDDNVTQEGCIQELLPLVSDAWKTAHAGNSRPTLEALLFLAERFSVRNVSMEAIVEAARARQTRVL